MEEGPAEAGNRKPRDAPTPVQEATPCQLRTQDHQEERHAHGQHRSQEPGVQGPSPPQSTPSDAHGAQDQRRGSSPLRERIVGSGAPQRAQEDPPREQEKEQHRHVEGIERLHPLPQPNPTPQRHYPPHHQQPRQQDVGCRPPRPGHRDHQNVTQGQENQVERNGCAEQ